MQSNKNISDYLSRMNLKTPSDDEVNFEELENGVSMIYCNNIDNLDQTLSESLKQETDNDEELQFLKERIDLNDFDMHKKHPFVKE